MTSVPSEERAVDDTELGQQPCKKRQFEDQSHYEHHSHECTHIGIEVDLIHDIRTDLIFGKETEGERKDKAVAHGTAQIEHEGSEQKCRPYASLFVLVQGWGDEPPHLEYKIRERHNKSEPERSADMGQELGGNINVDYVNLEVSG